MHLRKKKQKTKTTFGLILQATEGNQVRRSTKSDQCKQTGFLQVQRGSNAVKQMNASRSTSIPPSVHSSIQTDVGFPDRDAAHSDRLIDRPENSSGLWDQRTTRALVRLTWRVGLPHSQHVEHTSVECVESLRLHLDGQNALK